jgi:hypothetical protein
LLHLLAEPKGLTAWLEMELMRAISKKGGMFPIWFVVVTGCEFKGKIGAFTMLQLLQRKMFNAF